MTSEHSDTDHLNEERLRFALSENGVKFDQFIHLCVQTAFDKGIVDDPDAYEALKIDMAMDACEVTREYLTLQQKMGQYDKEISLLRFHSYPIRARKEYISHRDQLALIGRALKTNTVVTPAHRLISRAEAESCHLPFTDPDEFIERLGLEREECTSPSGVYKGAMCDTKGKLIEWIEYLEYTDHRRPKTYQSHIDVGYHKPDDSSWRLGVQFIKTNEQADLDAIYALDTAYERLQQKLQGQKLSSRIKRKLLGS